MIGLLFNEEHREASLVFYTTPKTITHKPRFLRQLLRCI